jgi:ACS family tartrate transporter-like MFS transporter
MHLWSSSSFAEPNRVSGRLLDVPSFRSLLLLAGFAANGVPESRPDRSRKQQGVHNGTDTGTFRIELRAQDDERFVATLWLVPGPHERNFYDKIRDGRQDHSLTSGRLTQPPDRAGSPRNCFLTRKGNTSSMTPYQTAETAIGERTRRTVSRRLMPFLFILYLVAYLDRVNLGFAGLQMTRELGFSDAAFGFGSGIFSIGYFVLSIPGSIMVEVWGARKVMSRLMITWGILAAATAWVRTPAEFYGVRCLLGAAEAGFFPGLVVYLSHWYRAADRGRATALFMTAIPASQAIGAPLSALLLRMHWFGLSGWRWLLMLEGMPALVLGIVVLFYLTDRPRDANWLPADERNWLEGELAREANAKKAQLSIGQALRNPNVLLLSAIYFFGLVNNYGLSLWLPKMLQRSSSLGVSQISLLAAIPYVLSLPALLVVGWHSDHTGERKMHTAVPRLLAGVALFGASFFTQSVGLTVALLSLAVIGLYSAYAGFWPLPTMLLGKVAAAAGIGMINSVGNLGGFAGPYLIGWMSTNTGGFRAGLLALAACATTSGLLVSLLRLPKTSDAIRPELAQEKR